MCSYREIADAHLGPENRRALSFAEDFFPMATISKSSSLRMENAEASNEGAWNPRTMSNKTPQELMHASRSKNCEQNCEETL
jgi:hypothetical protein